MVTSKRCKICTTLDPSNMPISGEYFGKQIPILVEKICGVELDARKINGILVCEQCTLMLLYAESFIDKLKKSVQRLQTTAKTPKAKSKDTSVVEAPKSSAKAKLENGLTDTSFTKIADDSKILNGEEKPTPAKVVKRRKSVSAEQNKNDKNVTKKLKLDETVDASSPTVNSTTNCNDTIDVNDEMHEVPQSNDQSVKEKPNKLNCVLCEKAFPHKKELREHIESSHMGEKLKECPNCFMEFRSVQKYESHVFKEKCNTTLSPCQFENCNRRFKNAYRMEEHMREKHLLASDL